MNTEQYEGNYFDHESAFQEITEPSEIKRTRGGKRAGAGRKREYTEDTKRLKCPISVASLANAFITILEKFSNKGISNHAWACRLDGGELKENGSGRKSWTNADAIQSPFSIRTKDGGGYDERMFLLAFKTCLPEGVAFGGFWDGRGLVDLRWQRADEVARVMTEYGRLYSMRNKLPKDLQTLANSMPDTRDKESLQTWLVSLV